MGSDSKYFTLCNDILRAITRHPEDVKVESQLDEKGVLLRVWLNREDFPLVIGREGRTINAVRELVRVAAISENARVALRLEDDPRGPQTQ